METSAQAAGAEQRGGESTSTGAKCVQRTLEEGDRGVERRAASKLTFAVSVRGFRPSNLPPRWSLLLGQRRLRLPTRGCTRLQA